MKVFVIVDSVGVILYYSDVLEILSVHNVCITWFKVKTISYL